MDRSAGSSPILGMRWGDFFRPGGLPPASGRPAGGGRPAFFAAMLLLLSAGPAPCVAGGTRSRPRIGFLGVWDRAKPLLEQASRDEKVPVVFLEEKELLGEKGGKAAEGLRVLFVLNLKREDGRALSRLFRGMKDRPRIVPLDARASQAPLVREGLLEKDPRVPPYWRASGLVNMRRLLVYVAKAYLGEKRNVLPPAAIPDYGYYLPGIAEALPDLKSFREKAGWKEGRPRAALLIQQSFWVTRDTAVIDAEIRALERAGFNVVTLFGDTGTRTASMLEAVKPDILVEDRHGSFWGGEGKPLLERLDVPYLRPISMLAYTIPQWLADPRGLHPRDRANFMTLQELHGTVDPIVVGGLKEDVRGFKLHVPVPGRADRFARRAWNWYSLRKKPNSLKRIVIVYYNKSLGKDDFLRGSPTGAFLDGPRSLMRFLPRMKSRGYDVGPLPRDEGELLRWIAERGRNIGPWAQGDLERMADRPGVVLVPARKLEGWMAEKLTLEQRAALAERFGPPPGRLMVVTRNGEKQIVLPMVRLGRIILAPQPLRGEREDERLLHSRDVPPPYNYLAFYWWLQEEFHADAVIHWGTHGSLELLPGKEAGLAPGDWSDLLTGDMPVVNPWIMDNLGEATLSRRRSYCVLVDHLVPPAVSAGLSGDLRKAGEEIEKFETLERGALKEAFRKRITELVKSTRIDETLGISGLEERLLTDGEIEKAASYLHRLFSETTPTTLHVLGKPPDRKLLAPYLAAVLGGSFLKAVAALHPGPEGEGRLARDRRLRALAEDLVRRCVLGKEAPPPRLAEKIRFARKVLAGLERAGDEIGNLLNALEGRYVPPGPGPDPIRNPACLPSGRNLYALNPEEIPTRPSWEIGKKLVDELLRRRHPRKVGIDLNGMNTMRDFGVMESQVLYLLGVRPVWDSNGLVEDVEVIPRKELGRPRVDVFIAMGGQYKENFPTRVKLLDKAVRLAAACREKDNLVREGSDRLMDMLLARGYSRERAALLSRARIFGTKQGNMSGTNILHLVPRSGAWCRKGEITSVYVDTMSFVYTKGAWGKKMKDLFHDAIQGTDTLVRVWASNMTSQLSNHHSYEYLGGLSMAVREMTGREPEAFIADVRDPAGPRLREFHEVLDTSFRTELLGRKWIKGMKGHGYAGAGMMAELVKNTFGWEVTRPESVSDGVWNEIYRVYVKDRYGLGLRKWFRKVNPHAFQDIAAVMLEAARKGFWKADPKVVRSLARIYAESVARFGPSAGLVSGGNRRLEDYVERNLDAPGDRAAAEAFRAALARSRGVGEGRKEKVRGPKLALEKKAPEAGPRGKSPLESWLEAAALACLGLLVLAGMAWKFGVPRP